MKKFTNSTWIFVIAMTSILISFWITRSWAIARWQETNPVWLQNAPAEVIQNEEVFSQWIETTRQTLTSQQVELGQLLQNPESQDQVILTQADKIAQTHAQLLRGIGQHLKSIRSVLPDNQKKLLTEFCIQTLRGPVQRAGHGRQEQHRLQQNRPGQPGFGNGFRRGQNRGCCGLVQKLQLTEEQINFAKQKDPAFETDINLLQDQLLSERQKLLLLLEDQQEQNGRVPEQIERIITAHNALEKRLIDYVLIVRPHFTMEQQNCLFGLCKKNQINP